MPAAYEKPMKLLHELDPTVRIKALREIGYLKASECVTDVLRLTKDENDDVRVEAMITLGKIGDTQIGNELLTLIDTGDIPLLMELINTLGILGANGFTKSSHYIEKKIDHPNFRVRKFVIQSLGKCGTPASIEKMYEVFNRKESSVEIKELIANAIGQIGGSRAIEILTDLSKEGLMEIRRAAIKALGESRTPAALEVLGKILKDKKEDKVIRNYAEEAVKKIIEGAKAAFLQIKQRAEEILKG